MKFTTSALLALLPLVSAHFEILSPKSRDAEETTQDQFPCGGANTVSARTPFALSGGTITVSLEHTVTNVEILLAVGNDPGSAFNTILRKTFLATGLGEFCIDSLVFPELTTGTNATIQVQSNGHNGGGLYSCADVTLVTSGAEIKQCNTPGIQIGTAEVSGHANGTAYSSTQSSAAAPAASSSATRAPTAATPSASATGSSGAGMVSSAGVGSVGLIAAAVVAMLL